jgi:multiple sugar transport system ATP-binding protein
LPILHLNGLSKTYSDGTPALRDFSLDIGEGEVVTVVGPSGCGKSTLLRLVAGLETPTTGSIRFGELSLDLLAPQQRDMALVFQSYTLFPNLNLFENMGFGLKLRGVRGAELKQKVTEAAQWLSIENLLNKRPSEVSGGQRQRAALGRALLRQPRAFLFDEPLSSLDAQMRQQLRVEIQKLQRRSGTAMLYVTHDQTEALTLGHRVVVLDEGVIQQVASPTELISKPRNTQVAAFIGSPGMNLWKGHLTVEHTGVSFEWEGTEGKSDSQWKYHATKTTEDTSSQNEFQHAQQKLPLGRYPGYLGVRPEDLIRTSRSEDSSQSPSHGLQISGKVEAMERSGKETCLHLKSDTGSFALLLPPSRQAELGEIIHASASQNQVIFFDEPGLAFLYSD